MTQNSVGRPITRYLTFFSVITWVLMIIHGTVYLMLGIPESFTFSSLFSRPILYFIAPSLILTPSTVLFWLYEKPRPINRRIANPDHDPQNLY
jgi:hypothetical protein